MEGQAESLLLTELMDSSTAVDSTRFEMLRTHGDVVNFLLKAHETDELNANAYSNVVSFCERSAMIKKISSKTRWDKALRSRSFFATKG